MFLNTRPHRTAVCLLVAILLVSFCGTAFAHQQACPCCGQTTPPGHMQRLSKADCCSTPACDHCAIGSSKEQTPVVAVNTFRSHYRYDPTQLFAAPTNSLDDHFILWGNAFKNYAPWDNQHKIPIYIQNQSILC